MFAFNTKNNWHWIATFFGVGLMRPAPGTWGSLAALPFGIFALMTGHTIVMVGLIFIVVFLGFIACDKVSIALSPNADPKEIVIDEVAGMLVALSACTPSAFDVALCFVVFRILDIFKPLLIGWIDHNKSGAIGIMGDDLAAGLITGALIIGIDYAGFS